MNANSADRDEALSVTRGGHERLRSEIAKLCNEARPQMIERLRDGHNDGDLVDNSALFGLLEEQARLEQRISQLKRRLASAQIAEPNDDGMASIGSFVRLRDLITNEVTEYELVGGIEADAASGRVSVDAPLGRALLGLGTGQVFQVETPGGGVQLEVLEVNANPVRKVA